MHFVTRTDSDLLTTREVAEVLGVKRSTVTRWVADGRIPEPDRIDGRPGDYRRPWYWTAATVEAMVAARAKVPP